MKELLFLAAAASLLTTISSCEVHVSNGWSSAGLNASTNVIATAAIPAGLTGIKVDNANGPIHVTGTDSPANTWTWKLVVHARTDAIAQQIASAARCQASVNGRQLELVVSVPDTNEPHSFESEFQINVPKTFAVETRNQFGATDIAGVAGPVVAASQNGRVDIRDISGRVSARASFDSLSVEHTGPATLRNQNGRITATGIGGRLDAETSFDSLGAKDVAGEAALRNQNGRIEASGIGGPLDAKTSFASLTARNVGGAVHLRDQNGRIEAAQIKGDADIETSFDNLSADEIAGNALLKNQNGRVQASGVTGSVKAATSFADMEITGAGTKFACHNQNGQIYLRATSAALSMIEAQTSFASLEVHLPAALKPAIQAHTSFAEVESDFPVLMKPSGADPFAEAAPDTARIMLENQNGKIRVAGD